MGGAGRAVIQHNPTAELGELLGVGDPLHLRPVALGQLVARIGNTALELAVIGEQQQPLGV